MGRNTKILISGGAGYIGSLLTEKLLKNYSVTVIDNLMFNTNILHLTRNKNLNFIYGDVRDKQLLTEEVKKADIIIPLAAYVGVKICDKFPRDAQEVNFEVIKNIAEIKSNDQTVIFPNTNSGYGTKDGSTYCTEETPMEPISLYGKTKVEAEKVLLQKPNVTVLRLATVFGVSPRMRPDLLVNYYTLTALREKYIVVFDGDFKRNFVYIGEVVDCFDLFCFYNYTGVYNLGHDVSNLSKKELAFKIKEHLPKTEVILNDFGKDPDKRNYIVSSQKLKEIGFKAEYSVDYGIEEIIRSYPVLEY